MPTTRKDFRFSVLSQRSLGALETFLLTPASPRPLGALRIGVTLVLLTQAYLLRGSLMDLFSSDGLVQGDLAAYISIPYLPRISWIVDLLSPWQVSERVCLLSTAWIYLMALCFLLFGWYTRAASIVAFLGQWIFMNTGESTTYGVDLYAHVFLFYMMFLPIGEAYSLDRLIGRCSGQPSWQARLGLRVLQLQLAITYFCSALEKAAGQQWWNGEVIWRSLTLPEYQQFNFGWAAYWPFAMKLLGWGSLMLEMGYIVFIWPKATRRLWVAGIVSMHLGIALFLGLGTFGAIMAVLTFTLFGLSADPAPEVNRAPATGTAQLALG